MIRLSYFQKISGYAGSNGIKSHTKDELEHQKTYINGYSRCTEGPTDREHTQTAANKDLYEMSGHISVENFKNLINYEIDTTV